MIETLVDEHGQVRLGRFKEPVLDVSPKSYLATNRMGRPLGSLGRRFAWNQFQFLGLMSEELVLGCAVMDIGYLAGGFCYAFRPSSGEYVHQRARRPLGMGTTLDALPETGEALVKVRGFNVRMGTETDPLLRTLTIDTPRIRADLTFHETGPDCDPMRIVTRTGPFSGWVYARKTAGLRVEGWAEIDGQRMDVQSDTTTGHHDWTAGYMRRDTWWNWGCLGFITPEGVRVGMNVSCGVNETSFSENCFWVDGVLHTLPGVHFEFDPTNPHSTWRLSSEDGRVSLRFEPLGEHRERVDALVVSSNFVQLIGRYQGHLITETGEKIAVDGALGYAENHYARW